MQQLDFINSSRNLFQREHLSLALTENFLSVDKSKILLHHLIEVTQWQQPRIKVYGKWHLTPRLLQFYGDEGLVYEYSKTLRGTLAWTQTLFELKTRVSNATGADYNCVLLNYYRDGQDTMGWHADDEPELGVQANIASLSLGANRDIHFKPKATAKITTHETIKLALPSGSLLTMQGDTQEYWLHHIPKRARCHAPRINLTFRAIHPSP
ncbi:MAG: alpha-ketoglutarate-dependent dioxygenase AlkB [Arenicellales bacterium]